MTAPREALLIQFPHRGHEHGRDRRRDCRHWTRGSEKHGRKFLSVAGQLIDRKGQSVASPDIRFWGEWEPPSTVERLSPSTVEGPQWLHTPYLPQSPPPNRHNTDPFVFGDHGFLYTVCFQSRGNGPSWLQNVPGQGSLILFGSATDVLTPKPRFLLDTVFVVDTVHEHRRADRRQLRPFVPAEYWDVTLDPIYGGSGTGCTSTHDGPYTLYSGATPDHKVNGMFSFFPCRAGSYSDTEFPRPQLLLDGLLPKAQAPRPIPTEGATVSSVWHSVVQQVREHGCDLGVVASMPNSRRTACD